MKNEFANIDDYIAQFPIQTRQLLEVLRTTIHEVAPNATEAIKYGIPTFVLNGNLVHFAGYKKHIGFYPAPSGIRAFQEELSSFKQAKGSVQFPLDKELPLNLISRIVKFRVEENLAKVK